MSENGLTKQELDRIKKFASENKASVLTILIDDIVGSSKMIEKMGDDAFQKLKEKDHDKPFMKIITRSKKGEVIKARGDGFLAVFAEPSTAVERALELQENLYEHEKIRIRIGLSMGQVIVKQVGVHKDVVGHFANWAARAESASEPGHILVTRGVYENASAWLPKSKASWKRHGFYVIKEGEQPLELFEPYNANIIKEPMTKPLCGICTEPEAPLAKELIGLINDKEQMVKPISKESEEPLEKEFIGLISLTKQEVDKIMKFASERKASVITFLISDILHPSLKGYSAFDELKEKYHDKPFMEIITRNGTGKVIKSQCRSGEIIKHRGDGFLAIFSDPSIAVERALAFLHHQHHHGHEKIRVRIGISMGQVILGELIHKDVAERYANWAARAEAMSEAGHILVTRGIYENAVEWLPKNDPCFSWKRHGSYQLRKREKELELFEPYNTSITAPLVKPRGICKDDTKFYDKEFISKEFIGRINDKAPFQINIWTEKKGSSSKIQDVKVVPKIESFQYNIGDKIAVCFESTEDAYVYIFNIGPTGDITPLFPNQLCRDNYVKAGMTYKFPSDIADFDWELQEPTGTEIIKVFATKTPADMSKWMKEMWFERADSRNIRVIASKSIEKMPPDQWTESSCSFVVVKS